MLLLSLSVMNEEAKPLGLHINRSKTKIQQIGEPCHVQPDTPHGGRRECRHRGFLRLYLGSLMDRKGRSDLEIHSRIVSTRSCMTLVDRHSWRSLISADTKISKVTGYSSSQHASPLLELTCHMGSHSDTCHPAEVTFQPLPPAEAGTRFSDPEGMQG